MSSSTAPFLDPNRLLSVQSHVVSGYVGNRAATFPLQLLGYDVDVVNTVQFSNHTGYGHTNGHKTTPEQLDAVFKGLETNGLCRWSRCLTGYIPGAPALQAVGREIEKLKRRAKAQGEDVLYLLDPVMGDIGKGLYVAEDVVPIYRQLLSLASIITPNQFETELLSETKITSPRTLLQALQTLHSPPYNVEHVVISSIPLPISLAQKLGLPLSSSAAPGRYTSLLAPKERSSSYSQAEEAKEVKEAEAEDEILICFASTRPKQEQSSEGDADAMPETYGYALPTIRGYYSGVGDLFSALVLGHYKDQRSPPQDAAKEEKEEKEGRSGRTLERAVSLALLGVQIVLLKTHLSTLPLNDNNNDKKDNNYVGDLDCIPSDDELDKEDNREDKKEDDDVEPLRRPARRARRMRLRELRVVQERRALMDLADDENEDGGWKGKRLDWDALLREA